MADLEEHAFKRDKRFLVRLVLGLIVATLGGLWLGSRLTNPEVGGCGAKMFGTVAPDGQPGSGRPTSTSTTP